MCTIACVIKALQNHRTIDFLFLYFNCFLHKKNDNISHLNRIVLCTDTYSIPKRRIKGNTARQENRQYINSTGKMLLHRIAEYL